MMAKCRSDRELKLQMVMLTQTVTRTQMVTPTRMVTLGLDREGKA